MEKTSSESSIENECTEIFKFSPLQNKSKKIRQQTRLCKFQFIKTPKSPCPTFLSNYKTSAHPTTYYKSSILDKLESLQSHIENSESPSRCRSSRGQNYVKSYLAGIFIHSPQKIANYASSNLLKNSNLSHQNIKSKEYFSGHVGQICKLKTNNQNLTYKNKEKNQTRGFSSTPKIVRKYL
ncbi:hypothetical protein SteCoe_38704 [Stentor coeruleus]|uniref:Uncharacterized protein n=1 Tax=Stentor coeruleus TaxID=5963 RepID=A0A1R2ALD9_9CILI|nr:hypothetical protein SteCoe_38704 [Stentor coeruleus]